MSERIVATEENLRDLFEGVTIEFEPFWDEKGSCPGWECKACGWRVGAQGLPPAHYCPEDGLSQRERKSYLNP